MEYEEHLTKREKKALRREEKIEARAVSERNDKTQKIGIIGVVIAAILLIGWWWQGSRLPIPQTEANKPVDQILDTDWYLSKRDAPLRVIEYSDFQCPACKVFAGIDQKLAQRFGDRVGFAYRHFPLRQIHTNSNLAAQAAEAAGKAGKFWDMAALLFQKQEEWGESRNAADLFKGYAKTIGLDEQAFASALSDKQTKILVEADYLSGLMAKINSTPTFFVNGQKINNLRGPDDLVARIDLMLKEATGSAQP